MTLLYRRRTAKVLAVQCGQCGLWVKPRYLKVPTWVCRDCDKTTAHQRYATKPASRYVTVLLRRTVRHGGMS